MLKVYCYSKCSTCKKALKWLDENKIKHEVVDIKAIIRMRRCFESIMQ